MNFKVYMKAVINFMCNRLVKKESKSLQNHFCGIVETQHTVVQTYVGVRSQQIKILTTDCNSQPTIVQMNDKLLGYLCMKYSLNGV